MACGFKAIIAPSFGTVFLDDCMQVGLLALVMDEEQVQMLAAKTGAAPQLELTIDLELQVVSRPDMAAIRFDLLPRLRRRFMLGLEDLDETSPFADQAEEFRQRQRLQQPWLYQTKPPDN